MKVSLQQVSQLKDGQAQSRARHWQAVADAALPPARRQDPQARLKVLADAVAQAQGPQASALGIDVQQTAQWLALGLQQGVAWRETRALALLHAAASLGAMWFVDGRLLPPAQMLSLQATLEATASNLLAQAHGQRYKAAAERERERRPALRQALARVLAAPDDAAALQALSLAAFAGHAGPAPAEEAEDQPTHPGLEQFLQRERALLAAAGVQDKPLATLCVAGDLAFGQGRCIRMLAAAPVADAERAAWMKEMLNVLARPQP